MDSVVQSCETNATIGKDIRPISTPLTTSYLKTGLVTAPTNETILDRFKRFVMTSPNKECVVIADVDTANRQAITFKECDYLSNGLASSLIKSGVGIKDAIAILMPNCTEFIVSWQALLKCHAYPAFVSFNMRSGEDLKLVLNDLKAVGVILHTGKSEEYYEIIKNVFGKFLTSKHDPDIPTLKFVVALGSRPLDGAMLYDNMVHTEVEREVLLQRVNTVTKDSPCAVFQTSGSTGRAKLVVHRHFGIVNNVIFQMIRFRTSESGRYFSDRPLTWSGGFLGPFATCIAGLTSVTIDTTISVVKRDVHSILQIIAQEKCTMGLMMPYMLYDILKLPSLQEYQLDNLKSLWTSGQRIPDILVEGIKKKLPNVRIGVGYGSTETYLISNHFYDVNDKIEADQKGTVGYPYPGFEIKITDEFGKLVPVGTSGNIKFKTFQLFTCYLNDEEKTNEKIEDGWFDLEDVAYFTENGYLVFACKKSDMVKRGTVLIAPTNIENVILTHPAVNKVVVVAVPDPRLYEELCACIVLHADKPTTEKYIIDYCNQKFTEQTLDGLSLTPKYVYILEDFPKLTNGKVDKITLRKMAAEKFDV
ncbi:unnamed protein product [Owenia fusiformis]|uniref:Uncharacterized protein n=1 Tax=Owenia fusiformis TaxID=6347 RepID=A0A8J1XJN9_OWEFU|nr:unnamed protein product [Owenia fusiformis]